MADMGRYPFGMAGLQKSPSAYSKLTCHPPRVRAVSGRFYRLNPDLLCINVPSPGIKENRKKRDLEIDFEYKNNCKTCIIYKKFI
jgi:hypothetical protein